MNGTMHSAPNVVDVMLKRGPVGLGFNIVGGSDQQYITNDSGIYVSKIKENGMAAVDGRLKEGDKILAINGIKLEGQAHSDAVELFRTAGEEVVLRVQQKSSLHTNGPTSPPSKGESSLKSIVAVVGAAALIAFLYMRFQPQLRKYF